MNLTIDGNALDHYETAREQVDPSHDKLSFIPLVLKGVPASTTELELWERVFPRDVPQTHRIAYRWVDRGGRSWVEIGLELIPTGEQTPGAPPTASEVERTRLEAMDLKSLQTLAAEKEIGIGPKWSKAKLIAEILAKSASGE